MQVEERFQNHTIYTSDCCGEYLTDGEAEHELCPRCREHCEVVCEEVAIPLS
jgi:hypothetical protein